MAESKVFSNHDGLCQYQHNDERCPLPGNISNTPGRGGRFHCLHHSRDGNRGHDQAQDEHFRLFADRACVQEYIENTYFPELRRMWQANIEDNADWIRANGETKSDYIARIRQLHHDRGLTGAVKRMPGT